MPRRSWRCRGDPTADWPNPRWPAEVLNMFKVSAVLPRRSAILTVLRGATAITDGTTAEPRRSWRCQCGLCRTSTAVAPRLRCDGTSTAEARRNMLKVAAVPPRRSAVLTVFRGASTINDGTTVEPRRSWRCHCGVCRTSTAVASRLRCDGGITGIIAGCGGLCRIEIPLYGGHSCWAIGGGWLGLIPISGFSRAFCDLGRRS